MGWSRLLYMNDTFLDVKVINANFQLAADSRKSRRLMNQSQLLRTTSSR